MFSDILSTITTTEELTLMRANLADIKMAGAHGNASSEATSPDDSPRAVISSLHKVLADIADSHSLNLSEVVLQLEEQLKALPICTLTIAFLPTDKQIRQFASHINHDRQNHVVLDIQRDASLLGGATIEFAGKYADYSLQRRLDNFWETGVGNIAKQSGQKEVST